MQFSKSELKDNCFNDYQNHHWIIEVIITVETICFFEAEVFFTAGTSTDWINCVKKKEKSPFYWSSTVASPVSRPVFATGPLGIVK